MGKTPLKPLLLNDASRLYDEPERKDKFVVARHFVEVASDKRKKEPYIVENVLVVKVVTRFETRDEAWEFAYGRAGWAGAEQAQRGRKQHSNPAVRRRSQMPRTALRSAQ
jgi:hypothetical protein